MSHVIKVDFTQTIDRRIAKFSTRKKKLNRSYLHSVRLNPLSSSRDSNGASTPSIPAQFSTDKDLSSSIDQLPSQPVDRENQMVAQKSLAQIAQRWQILFKNKSQSAWKTPGYVLWLTWKRSLEKGVRLISSARRIRLDAVSLIAKAWRIYAQTKKHKAARLIGRKWLQFRAQRQYRRIVKAAFVIQFYMKLRHRLRQRAAVMISKNYRGYVDRKRYRPLVVKAVKARQHQSMLKRQAMAVQERRRRTEAVKVIEKAYERLMHRHKMREYRKYLWSLPYECRVLYLKFKQVKSDADSLKADVESMIAKKEEERLAKNGAQL